MAPSATYESGHFYFAQIGYSHFAATSDAKSCQRKVEMSAFCKIEMSALSASKVSSKGVQQVHGIGVCFAFWVLLFLLQVPEAIGRKDLQKIAVVIAAAEA
jgi:hypothetical protein